MKIRKFGALLSILLLLGLFGCFKTEHYRFQEGIFSYQGEAVLFNEELYIEELDITFNLISEEEYLERNNVNVLKNRKDKKCYNVDFYIKFNEELEGKTYSFESLPKTKDISDAYDIKLNIENDKLEIKVILYVELIFQYEIRISTDDYAGSIWIMVEDHQEEGEIKKSKKYSIPDVKFKD